MFTIHICISSQTSGGGTIVSRRRILIYNAYRTHIIVISTQILLLLLKHIY